MSNITPATRYKNHRFPIEIIRHAVWLYFQFCLSYRDVEELLLDRGITFTYEAIRKWCHKFGQRWVHSNKGTQTLLEFSQLAVLKGLSRFSQLVFFCLHLIRTEESVFA